MNKFNILKFINMPCFIISLAIGLFFVYISAPTPNTIFVYPNPDNVKQILYFMKLISIFHLILKIQLILILFLNL